MPRKRSPKKRSVSSPRRQRQQRHKVKLDPSTVELLRTLRTQFVLKHGREPAAGDKAFEGLTPEAMKAEIVKAMKETGIHPSRIYAYTKTGMLLSEERLDHYPPEDVKAWDAACQEYLKLTQPGSDTPVSKKLWSSEIPELQARPLTVAEYNHVLACMKALAPVQALGMSIAARAELAAALLADVCSISYSSAIAQGIAGEGPMRYQAFEQLVLARAREIYGQGRV